MNEVEPLYKDKIDFIRFDLNTEEGYCEYAKHGFSHIPAMIYISKGGKEVDRTDYVVRKEDTTDESGAPKAGLISRFDSLIKQP